MAPPLLPRVLVGDHHAVRALVGGRIVASRVAAEGAENRAPLGEGPQRVDDYGYKWVPVRVLRVLPTILCLHVRGGQEAVVVNVNIERVRVIPTNHAFVARLCVSDTLPQDKPVSSHAQGRNDRRATVLVQGSRRQQSCGSSPQASWTTPQSPFPPRAVRTPCRCNTYKRGHP